MYEVTVGNIGMVHEIADKEEATSVFEEYVSQSKRLGTRAFGEQVTLSEDGEPIEEYVPSTELIAPIINEIEQSGDVHAALFEVAEGLYWFATDYHEGMGTTLYRIMSTLGFKPAPSATGIDPESYIAQEVYEHLQSLKEPGEAEAAALALAELIEENFERTGY